MIKQILTVAVYVEDQQKAKEFWTKKVGFEVAAEHQMGPNAYWLEVGPKNAESKLVIYPKSMMTNWNELKPSIVFGSDDVFTAYETMKANGVEFLDAPKEMSWGTFVQFKDEDGNEYILKG